MFLISEPTPWVRESDIRQVLNQYEYTLDVRKHTLGYDGFIKDVIIIVRKAPSHEQMVQLEKKLHKVLYGSDYKAERATLDLRSLEGKVYFAEESLNYQVSMAEINDWFITKKELFIDDNGTKYSMKTFLDTPRSGVFFSDRPGFVAFVIDKKVDLCKKKSDIRKFTLNSDILLGAFSNSNKLIFIGREREAGSLNVLPPLNTETILTLASCQQSSLSQSLDMNDVLAGKIVERRYDWCPTYLSPQLENSEYGDLLITNDLLLKGWSESGRLNFHDINYPEPHDYPFSRPLFNLLHDQLGLNSLVYNWNTTNVVQTIRMDGYTIYALSNTGSLPVSYFNDQYTSVSVGLSYENKAYNYFSGTIISPDLARAVQYTFLYSVFYDNSIHLYTKYNSANNKKSKKPYLLESRVKKLLYNIMDSTPSEIMSIALAVSREQLKDSITAARERTRIEFESYANNEIKNSGRNSYDPDVVQWKNDTWSLVENNLNEQIDRVISANAEMLCDLINEVRQTILSMPEKELAQACKYLSYPRGVEVAKLGDNPNIITLRNAMNQMTMLDGVFKNIYKPFGVELSEVMSYYTRELQFEEGPWIKTPTLIRSSMDDGKHFIGGHNVSAFVTRVAKLDGCRSGGNSVNGRPIRSRATVIPQTFRSQRGL